MDALIGFAVLLAPLLLILILLSISIWFAVKGSKDSKRRWFAGIKIFLLIFLLPFGDEIAGQFYLAGLCATKGGYEVYDTIELPAEYWDEQGKPKFFNEKGHLRSDIAGKYLTANTEGSGRYSNLFPIDKRAWVYREKFSGNKLGTRFSFRFWGGWLRRNITLSGPTADSCRRPDLDVSQNFYIQILQPEQSSKSRENK